MPKENASTENQPENCVGRDTFMALVIFLFDLNEALLVQFAKMSDRQPKTQYFANGAEHRPICTLTQPSAEQC